MIELFIEGRKIDLTDDLEINFTYETIDADKLSAIKNSFSKTVAIQGTPNNNATFGHIWRFDKYIGVNEGSNILNSYDPHKKVEWFINKNGGIINSGYCTLDNIIIKDEVNITYQLTLYGGLGSFFYTLAYNKDGSPKLLSDLFWNWKPKTSLIGYGNAMSPSEESSQTLLRCSAAIVANSYHNLNPTNAYTGTTNIDNDIVFVPCYTGLYENFDSKHCIVSTFNQNYSTVPPVMETDTKNTLHASFPDTYTENGKTYTTLDKNFTSSGAYRYGLVTFSRDVDAWEAGDLRVNELPLAVRLSKLMTVISNPQNNGGFVVEWDDDIKNSYYWNYGWVMLGRLKQEKENLNLLEFSPSTTYDGQSTIIDVNKDTGAATTVANATSYDLPSNTYSLGKGNYTLLINELPRLVFKCTVLGFDAGTYDTCISGSINDNGATFRYVWTTSVLVHKIYIDNTLVKTIADIYYYTTDSNNYYFGYNRKNVNVDDIKTVLNGKIKERFVGTGDIDEYKYHHCTISNPTVSSDGNLQTFSFEFGNERISTLMDLSSDTTNFKVEQSQGIMWTNLSNSSAITAGLYGTDAISFAISETSAESPYGFLKPNGNTIWGFSEMSGNTEQNYSWAYFNLNESRQNGVLDAKSSGFNIIELDKKTLFANSKSPMKYLSGFCKLMNYRFICDSVKNKIYIKTLKNYYINEVINIDNRVDVGRDIQIKNVTTTNKTINVGLKSPETYPVYLFNKTSRDKFNTVKYDTGIKYNASETSILNDLVYENLAEWQQSSVYYTINPQFPRAYNVQSISWTLFNVDGNDSEQIEKKEIFTTGTPSNPTSLLANDDFLPKIALFGKENEEVDFESSLVFLNGFVKNYDYTLAGSYYVISPRVCLSNDMYEMYFLNQERCYVYDFNYSNVFTDWGYYSLEQKGSASSWVLPMFTRDLYNVWDGLNKIWVPTENKAASWNIVNQDGLDNLYSLVNTKFLKISSGFDEYIVDYDDFRDIYEYTVNGIPSDNSETERIYNNNWKDYLDDLYDRNTRDVTAFVDLSGFGDANEIMRYFYGWKSHLWIITKLENFKIGDLTKDRFTKVRLHKIANQSTWTDTES